MSMRLEARLPWHSHGERARQWDCCSAAAKRMRGTKVAKFTLPKRSILRVNNPLCHVVKTLSSRQRERCHHTDVRCQASWLDYSDYKWEPWSDLRMANSTKRIAKTKIPYSGAMLFNSLPYNMKDMENISLQTFKNFLKTYFLDLNIRKYPI